MSHLHYACTPHLCLTLVETRKKAEGPLELDLVVSMCLIVLLNFVCSLNDAYETYLDDKV